MALGALADLGPAGAELADILPALLAAEDDWEAIEAAVAYWRVTADSAPVVPVLMRHLKSGPRGVAAARCLAEMGPAARAAVPVLRRAITSAHRDIDSGLSVASVGHDETWMQACIDAIEQIEHTSGDE